MGTAVSVRDHPAATVLREGNAKGGRLHRSSQSKVWTHEMQFRIVILIPFQDETNNATLSSWQDHEEPMSSWSHPLGRLRSKPRTSGNSGKPWRCCSQRS